MNFPICLGLIQVMQDLYVDGSGVLLMIQQASRQKDPMFPMLSFKSELFFWVGESSTMGPIPIVSEPELSHIQTSILLPFQKCCRNQGRK